MGCSRRKLEGGPHRALDLYTGFCFDAVRRLISDGGLREAQIRILSARHGLLRPTEEIEAYDCPLVDPPPPQLRTKLAMQWRSMARSPAHVIALLEAPYMSLLVPLLSSETVSVTWFPRPVDTWTDVEVACRLAR